MIAVHNESEYTPITELLQMKYKNLLKLVKQRTSDPSWKSTLSNIRLPIHGTDGSAVNQHSKPVDQVDIETGAVLRRYHSQKDAATAMCIPYKSISRICVAGGGDTCGFGWRYYNGHIVDSTSIVLSSLTFALSLHDFVVEQDNISQGRMSVAALLQLKDSNMQRYGKKTKETVHRVVSVESTEEVDPGLHAMASRSSVRVPKKRSIYEDEDQLPRSRRVVSPEAQPTDQDTVNNVGGEPQVEQCDFSTGELLHRYVSLADASAAMGYTEDLLHKCCLQEIHTEFGWRYSAVFHDAGISTISSYRQTC
jgi:hypothetical protein